MTKGELHTRISQINKKLDVSVRRKDYYTAVALVQKRAEYMKMLINKYVTG